MAISNRTMRRARDTAQESLGQLRDSAGEYYDQGRERMSTMAHSLEDSMREQPVRWLLLGIGIGCIVSAIFTER